MLTGIGQLTERGYRVLVVLGFSKRSRSEDESSHTGSSLAVSRLTRDLLQERTVLLSFAVITRRRAPHACARAALKGHFIVFHVVEKQAHKSVVNNRKYYFHNNINNNNYISFQWKTSHSGFVKVNFIVNSAI